MMKTWKRYREWWGCLTLSASVSQKSKGKWLDAEKAFREAVAEILPPSVIMYGIKHTNVWTRWVQTAWTSAVSMPTHRQHQRSKSDTNLGYHRKTRFTADFFFHLLWVCMGESWACAIVCVGKSENNSGSVLPHHVNLRGGTWAWKTPLPEGPFHCPPSSIFICLSLWKQSLKCSRLTLIEDEYIDFMMISQEVIHLQESRSWIWSGASVLSRLWSPSQENPEL